MIMKAIIFVLSATCLFAGCRGGNDKKSQTTAASTDTVLMVGHDRDGHGCLGSAGYTWSEVRQDCIRPFETGIRLTSATEPDATSCAYLVFSVDSTRAELFLPDRETTEILDRRALPSGGYAWNIEDDDTFNVRQTGQGWIIGRRGTILYREE